RETRADRDVRTQVHAHGIIKQVPVACGCFVHRHLERVGWGQEIPAVYGYHIAGTPLPNCDPDRSSTRQLPDVAEHRLIILIEQTAGNEVENALGISTRSETRHVVELFDLRCECDPSSVLVKV